MTHIHTEDSEEKETALSVPLFGMPSTTWSEPTFEIVFTIDCTCGEMDCHYCLTDK